MYNPSPLLMSSVRVVPPTSDAIGHALERVAFWLLCAFVFVLPWQDAEFLSGGSNNLRWIGFVLFGSAILRAHLLPQARRISELHYWLIAFAAWSVISLFWTLDWESTAARVGTYVQLLAVAWIIWILATSQPRIVKLLQSYVFGTYVCAIYTISNAMAGQAFGHTDLGPPKGDRYIMSGMNPNDAGMLIAPSIPMTLYLLARRPVSPWTASLYWLQLVLCGTTIFLSGSREALLEAAPVVVMLALTIPRLPSGQKVMAVMAIGAVAVASLYLVPRETWQRLGALGSEVTEGTMTHRTEIWKAGVELFRSHPLEGVGAAAHPAAVVNIIGRPLGAHNTFISVLVELGVVGELLLLGLLGAALFCARRMTGIDRILWMVILVLWCIGACSATWEYQKTTWFLLSLLVAHAYVRPPGADFSFVRRGTR